MLDDSFVLFRNTIHSELTSTYDFFQVCCLCMMRLRSKAIRDSSTMAERCCNQAMTQCSVMNLALRNLSTVLNSRSNLAAIRSNRQGGVLSISSAASGLMSS